MSWGAVYAKPLLKYGSPFNWPIRLPALKSEAERYDRPLRDVFALQDEIVRRITTTLKLELTLSQQGYLIPCTTENLEAYDESAAGDGVRTQLNTSRKCEGTPAARKSYRLDSKYAAAYALLGYDYFAGFVFALNTDPTGIERALKM
jgi:adenylate cyclase